MGVMVEIDSESIVAIQKHCPIMIVSCAICKSQLFINKQVFAVVPSERPGIGMQAYFCGDSICEMNLSLDDDLALMKCSKCQADFSMFIERSRTSTLFFWLF